MPEELSQNRFWDYYYKRTERNLIPFKASFELTHNCNLNCRHCYLPGRKRRGELSYSEVCSVLDQLAEQGCLHLNLTGGEIFTRSDIFQILKFARRKGFYIILLTNGTLLTPEIADRLKDLNINQVDISLYGMTEKTHESVTRSPGSLQKSLEGISFLEERNVPLCIKMTVMNLNVDEFPDVKAFAEKLKARFRYGYSIHPRLDGSKEPLAFRLSPSQGMELEMRKQSDFFKQDEKERASLRNNDLFYCNAGRNSLAITHYGRMNLCLQYHFPGYDLRKGSLSEGWKELIDYVKSAEPTGNYQCRECEFQEFCLWCPAEGWLNNGDPESCVSYFKELAELKKKRAKTENQTGYTG